ncbi:MAG: nucleotidyltransferase family protein [Candidatus Magnetomorum sp.]|nr:nucleotidyltransferase family protein [Candidatus Magnetomorum sp.]
MQTKKNIIKILKEQYPYLASEYGVKRLGLFGSYAKGEHKNVSDIDIVAEFEKSIGLKFIEFTEYLEHVLGKKTDVLTLEGIRGIMLKKVAENIEKTIIYV